MAENDSKQLPPFGSLDELVEFFDTHDMSEYDQALPEVDFEVNIQRRKHLVAIDEDLNDRLTEIAEQEQKPAELLVDLWLREKISSYPKHP